MPENKVVPEKSTQLIVLTGGPGAGKTAVLCAAHKLLGHNVVIFPEAASILFGGGFWRFDSVSAIMASQRAIYHVQKEMETLILEEKKWTVGLCDRGTLDGLAYWPGSESQFFEALSTQKDLEYAKYHAVIHLRTPGIRQGYNHQNPVRIETPEAAAMIDAKIHEIWKDHPRYSQIESTGDFLEKMRQAVQRIQSCVTECQG